MRKIAEFPHYAAAYGFAVMHGHDVENIQKVTFWDGRQSFSVWVEE